MPSVIPNPPVLATTINDRTASQHTAILQVLPSRLQINNRTASEHASILQVPPSRLPLLSPILADGGLQCSFFPPPPPSCCPTASDICWSGSVGSVEPAGKASRACSRCYDGYVARGTTYLRIFSRIHGHSPTAIFSPPSEVNTSGETTCHLRVPCWTNSLILK